MSLTKLRLRRGTTLDWAAADPVLSLGEPGYDVSLRRIKVGDGVTTWTSLDYQTGDASALTDVFEAVDTVSEQVILAGDLLDQTQDAAASVNRELAGGVMGIGLDGKIADPNRLSNALPTRRLDNYVTAGSADQTTEINNAFTAARAGGFALRATAGTTYRGKNLDPISVTLYGRGAVFKLPDGGAAGNVFTPTGACDLIGLTIDGNKAATTDGGSGVLGCGLYIENAAGWTGAVRLLGGPVVHDCWGYGINAVGDRSITDGDNAVMGAVLIEDGEAYNCESGFYFLGLQGVTNLRPYAHNNRNSGHYTNRCRRPRVSGVRSHFNGTLDVGTPANSKGYGYISVHCVDDEIDGGACNDNVLSGWCWGGADIPVGGVSTLVPGRRYRINSIEARRNGTGTAFAGITFDPTRYAQTGIAQVVDGKVTQFLSTHNGGPGVQITCADYLDLGMGTVDNNGTHGIAIAGKHVSTDRVRARNNGTTASHHGITVTGQTTEYGGHQFGRTEMAGNGDGLTTVNFGTVGSRLPSTFLVTNPNSPTPKRDNAQAITSTATYTLDADTYGKAKITAQAAALTIANPTGTPDSMQGFILRIKDNGTSRAITWGSQWKSFATLPTSTIAGKTLYLGFMWNVDTSTWDCIASQQEP